jgi:hypothetical protein
MTIQHYDEFVCKDPHAPPRMFGRTLQVTESKDNLSFSMDMPDNPTTEETDYLMDVCDKVAKTYGITDIDKRKMSIEITE